MVDSEWFSHEVQPYHQIVKGHSTSIECCSYHPNHEYEVFTGSDDKTIKCWDLFKFKCSNTFEGHTGGVWCARWSPHGKIFYSCSVDKTVKIWDVFHSNKAVKTYDTQTDIILWASINYDNSILASSSEDKTISLIDLKTDQQIKQIQCENIVYCIKWSEDEKYFFTSELGGIIRAYDAKTFQLLDSYGKFDAHDKAWCLDFDFTDFSLTGSTIFVSYERKVVGYINFNKETNKFEPKYEQQCHMNSIEFLNLNSKLKMLMTTCVDGSVRIWDTDHKYDEDKKIYFNKPKYNLLGHKDHVSQAAFAPKKSDKLFITTVSWDQNINLYKLDHITE